MKPANRVIEGTVLDAAGQPVPQARVSIVESPVAMPDMALLTDAAGRFVLGAPAEGRYLLGIDSDSAGSARQPVIISGSATAALSITLPRRQR